MNVSLTKKDEVNGVITIEIEKSDYQERAEKALNQYRNRVNLPGFRQGKVPKHLVKKMYGEAITAEELNKIIHEQLIGFIRENNLNILGEPVAEEREPVDYTKEEKLVFNFGVALTPEFDLNLTDKDQLTYFKVNLEDDKLEKQIEAYKSNYGTYQKIDEPSVDTDLLKGTLTELENGQPKEDGRVIENAIMMPSYVKDEATKKELIGVTPGKEVLVDPQKAYDNNEAEIASFLQLRKEEVKDIHSVFSFKVNEITRFQEAAFDQSLFDRVLGEGVATSEEDFKNQLRTILNDQFKPSSDYLFMKDAEELILKKMEDVKFPEETLKQFLLSTKEDRTPEQMEEDFPKILKDLKFHLAKEKILKEQNIQIADEEVEAMALEYAKSQFAQYGMTNVPLENLEGYAKSLLKNQDTANNMYETILNRKIQEWIMNTVKVTDKVISSDEMNAKFKQ